MSYKITTFPVLPPLPQTGGSSFGPQGTGGGTQEKGQGFASSFTGDVYTSRARFGNGTNYWEISATEMKTANWVDGLSGIRITYDGIIDANEGHFRGDITGATGTFSGTVNVGSLNIPNATSSDSFHTDTSGNSWWGCNVADFASSNDNADAYILNTGYGKFNNVNVSGMIRTAVFQKDVISVNAGSLVVAPNADVLDIDMLALDSATLATKGTATFVIGDVLRIKDGTDDEWMQVMGAITSYTNPGGSGNRIATITPSTTMTIAEGTINEIINGNKTSSTFFVVAADVTNKYFRFDFGSGASKVIDEVTLYKGSEPTPGSTWKWQGSNNATNWSDIGGTFDWVVGSQVITSLSGNTTGYRYYQMIGTTGQMNDGPYIWEFEFKIADYAAASNPYNVIRDKDSQYTSNNNPTWKKGASIVNYGQSGDGGIYMTASEANAPYMSVYAHSGSPWTDLVTKLRVGNLNGFLGYTTDEYGIAIGETNEYLKYDPTNGLRIQMGNSIKSIAWNGANMDATGFRYLQIYETGENIAAEKVVCIKNIPKDDFNTIIQDSYTDNHADFDDTNYGTGALLKIGKVQGTAVFFMKLPTAGAPSLYKIQKVELMLYKSHNSLDAERSTVTMTVCQTDWAEGTITGNNQPGTDNNLASVYLTANSFEVPGGANGYVSIDITQYYKYLVNGDVGGGNNYGLKFVSEYSGSEYAEFDSSEGTNPPLLRITASGYSDNKVYLASPNNYNTCRTIVGFSTEAKNSGNNIIIQNGGNISLSGFDTPGSKIYLNTSGDIVAGTAGNVNRVVNVGYVENTDTNCQIEIQRSDIFIEKLNIPAAGIDALVAGVKFFSQGDAKLAKIYLKAAESGGGLMRFEVNLRKGTEDGVKRFMMPDNTDYFDITWGLSGTAEYISFTGSAGMSDVIVYSISFYN